MNGVHDLGGMHGFGPIHPEPDDQEPVFHADWERRTFALTLASAALGRWSLDASRHARERLDPVDYLRSSYYAKWLEGLERLLVATGVVTAEELVRGTPAEPAPADLVARRLSADDVGPALARGGPVDMVPTADPRFRPGDRVRVRSVSTEGHTRAVRYAQARVGTIEVHHGCHVFPDRNAHGERTGEHLYGVVFTARELWGDTAAAGDTVRIDLWEPYLEPAP